MAGNDQADAGFKFRAFLSYNHADQRTVAWLHKALESYRIPKDLQGTPGRDGPIPKQLFPIFRDRDELSSSPDLSRSIKEALQASAYLIVVCTPASAKSHWVNQEITEFIKLGRADRIYALIVEGEPGESPDKGGCFPPALRTRLGADGTIVDDPSREVLAADLRPEGDGRDDAKLKLIAGLLGIPYNALRRREVAAARRRLLVTQAIAASMMLLTIAVAVAVWATWHFSEQSDERQIPGLRVTNHDTVLDLSGWRDTIAAQIARLEKRSSALSHDRYTLVKTQPQAKNYVHIVGTSSDIRPDIVCTRCSITPRPPDGASRTPHEFKVLFDISDLKLEEETTIDYTATYWNAFQSADQLWTGLRVLYQTDRAKLAIIFPPTKHPASDTIKFYYHDNKDHDLDNVEGATLEKDEGGRVSRLTWVILSPSTDRSYRVRWDWNDNPNKAGDETKERQ
jgi:hypothetical protein